jgi:hypothetical protein
MTAPTPALITPTMAEALAYVRAHPGATAVDVRGRRVSAVIAALTALHRGGLVTRQRAGVARHTSGGSHGPYRYFVRPDAPPVVVRQNVGAPPSGAAEHVESVMRSARRPMRTAEIAKRSGWAPGTVRRALRQLGAELLRRPDGSTRWRLP